MADYNTAAVELGMGRVAPPLKPRNFDEDFAEAVGYRDASRRGESPNEAMLSGIRAKQEIKDPLFELKKLEIQTQIAWRAAQLADNARAMQLKLDQLKNEQSDKNSLTVLTIQSKGDPQKIIQLSREFVPQSNFGRLAISQMVRSATTAADYHGYIKRVSALDAETRAEVDAINDPVSRNQALGLAEQAVAQRRENEREIAEIEALRSGAKLTTAITEKGVTKTFRPEKEADDTGPGSEPKTKTLDNGMTLAWMPGGKGIHVIKPDKKTEELTPAQLISLARSIQISDPASQIPKQIGGFLAQKVAGQILGTNDPAASSPAEETSVLTDKDGNQVKVPKSRVAELIGKGYR